MRYQKDLPVSLTVANRPNPMEARLIRFLSESIAAFPLLKKTF